MFKLYVVVSSVEIRLIADTPDLCTVLATAESALFELVAELAKKAEPSGRFAPWSSIAIH
jgi:hypothetical protein